MTAMTRAPASQTVLPNTVMMRLPEVLAVTGLSRSTVYSMAKAGTFPPIKQKPRRWYAGALQKQFRLRSQTPRIMPQ